MNDRIKQLAEQAGFITDNNKISALTQDITVEFEKFAELIVKECAGIDFRRELGLSSDQDYEVSQLIRKHFGVEE